MYEAIPSYYAEVNQEQVRDLQIKIKELASKIDAIRGEAEEKVVKAVLRTYLGREATVEDYKLCTRIMYCGNPDTYALTYKAINLGTVWIYSEGYDCETTQVGAKSTFSITNTYQG